MMTNEPIEVDEKTAKVIILILLVWIFAQAWNQAKKCDNLKVGEAVDIGCLPDDPPYKPE